jgi:hypothetical protein
MGAQFVKSGKRVRWFTLIRMRPAEGSDIALLGAPTGLRSDLGDYVSYTWLCMLTASCRVGTAC